MQKRIILVVLLIVLLVVFAFRTRKDAGNDKLKTISRQEAYKNKLTLQCSPDWNLLNSDSLANGISILPGWGNYSWEIASSNDSARLYFQQGINMYYAFHIIEAMASFKKAASFDSTNAMIHWGQALAYGPNINDFAYAFTPEAFTAAQKALVLSAGCSAKEKALIQAMSKRYTADSLISRASLNSLYADAMQNAYSQFPGDADISTLYADAMMLQHPWKYWKHNGEPHPWTGKLLEVLEKTLVHAPEHPGANHYYIHAVEASGNPQRALKSADRLAQLMPSVSHMVHMPSHIYIRSGLYDKGSKVNEMSIKGYSEYLALFPDVANNSPLYLIHNLHMQTACAMMGSNYSHSSATAKACRNSFDTSFMSIPPPLGCFIQYVYMASVINDVRFGEWTTILNAAPIPQQYIYANTLSHWARGMAFARQHNISSAKKELQQLRKNMQHADMLVVMEPFNSPVAAAKVAESLLEGVIAEQENNLPAAIAFLKIAANHESALIYDEPRDWILPVRPYLGAVLLKAGKFSEAGSVFKADLKESPNNHWALKGLYESLLKQHHNKEAVAAKKQLTESCNMAEMKSLPVVY